jgi:hypothetical protein
MKKTVVAAASALLTMPFVAVVMAAPASADPCGPPFQPHACCLEAAQASGTDPAQCDVVAVDQVLHFPDCDAMADAYARSNCLDEHLLGQR